MPTCDRCEHLRWVLVTKPLMVLRGLFDRVFNRGQLRYAQDLARSLAERHYPGCRFEPFDDVWGVLSQIDNMTTGLVRDPDPEGFRKWREVQAREAIRAGE